MATYKVPQDVEADDKLLGPFNFRQFIYLMIVAAAIGLGFVLYKVLPPLVIIPLPVVLFFGALALPLRKDQPMEIYLAAILSYYLKPRKHFWDPDGIESLVQITAPRDKEPVRIKNVSQQEAGQRLRYLSDLSDSRGWSMRGVSGPTGSPMNEDVFNEAQQAPDVLDDDTTVARNLDQMIQVSDQQRHQMMLAQFQTSASQPAVQPAAQATSYTPISTPDPAHQPQPQIQPDPQPSVQTNTTDIDGLAPQFDPYPVNMSQSVIQPLSAQPAPDSSQANNNTADTPEPASNEAMSPDIMMLANNTDLSVETIAREAKRINERETLKNDGEVFIALR